MPTAAARGQAAAHDQLRSRRCSTRAMSTSAWTISPSRTTISRWRSAGAAVPQFPGLLDLRRLRSDRAGRLVDRKDRSDLQPERAHPGRVLRPARQRPAAGDARHRSHRRRPGAARGDPGAVLPLRTVDGGDRDRAPDRFQALFRRRTGGTCASSRRTGWSKSTATGSWSRPGAGCWCASVHGVRPLPAPRATRARYSKSFRRSRGQLTCHACGFRVSRRPARRPRTAPACAVASSRR